MKDGAAFSAILYIVLYIIVLLVSFIILLIAGVDTAEAFSGCLSSLGNAGPALDSISSMSNYSAQPAVAKFVFSMDMILGRLEIYPVFIVLSMIFGRRK